MLRKIRYKTDYITAISILLIVICGWLYLRNYALWEQEGLIYWPGASLFAMWVLSHLLLLVKPKKLLQITGLILVFGLVHWVLTGFLTIILERFFRLEEHYSFYQFGTYLSQNKTYVLDGIIWGIVCLGIMSVIDMRKQLINLREQNTQLATDLSVADLRSLRKELNPHFLFNAMNGVAMKIRLKENKTAVAMIAALNDLLRLSLKKQDEKLVPLEEEVYLLQKYLYIERIRFEDRASVELHFPAALLSEKVPELILQPLVENAFKHSASHSESTTITVTARKEDERLILSVFNSAEDIHHINFADKNGIGIQNIIHRLRRLYGSDFRFKSQAQQEGLTFEINIPSNL